MLFLVFHAGENRYAIDASHAVEILPLVCWKHLPEAPAGVSGVFNYRGTPVPLVDLSELMTQKPCRTWMSTRVIVVSLSTESGDGTRLLGLLAEQVTETLRQNEEDFRHSAGSNAPYLGRIAVQPVGMVQRIELKHLLPADVQRRLFQRDAQTV